LPALQYERFYFEGLTGVFLGVRWNAAEGALTVDRLEVRCRVQGSPFRCEPHLRFIHPEFTVRGTSASPSLPTLLAPVLPQKRLNVKVDVAHGVIQWEGGERLYATFSSGCLPEEIGTLALSFEPGNLRAPFCLVDLRSEERALAASVVLQQVECSRLLPLLGQREDGWQVLQGEAEMRGALRWNAARLLEEASGVWALSHIAAAHPSTGLGVQIERCQGEIASWRRGEVSLSLCGGELRGGEWGCVVEEGSVAWRRGESPVVTVRGALCAPGGSAPLEAQGTGGVCEGGNFWLELSTRLGAAQALLSLCSPEEGRYLAQAEMECASCAEVRLLYPDAGLVEGSFSGRLSAWRERGAWGAVEVERLTVEGARFRFAPQRDVQIDGVFRATIGKGEGDVWADAWRASFFSPEWSVVCEGAEDAHLHIHGTEDFWEGEASVRRGSYTEEKRGIFCSDVEGRAHVEGRGSAWQRMQLAFTDATLPFGERMLLHSLRGSFECDASAAAPALFVEEGTVRIGGYPCVLRAASLSGGDPWLFSFSLCEGEEIARLAGRIEEGGTVTVDPTFSHLFGSRVERAEGVFDASGTCSRFDGALHLCLSSLDRQLDFLKKCGVWEGEELRPAVLPAQGAATVSFHYEPAAVAFDVTGTDIMWGGRSWRRLALRGREAAGEWEIERLQADDLEVQATLSRIPAGWQVRAASLTYPRGVIRSTAPMTLRRGEEGRWQTPALDLLLPNGLPCHIEQGACDVEELTGSIERLEIPFDGETFSVRDVRVCIQGEAIEATGASLFRERAVALRGRLDEESAAVTLQLQGDPGEVTCTFREGLCSAIRGACSGVDIDLVRSRDLFSGSVHLDMARLAPLLGESWTRAVGALGMGGGYVLEGEFAPATKAFTGFLKGEQVEFLGCIWQELLAQAVLSPERVQIQNISFADPAGRLFVKRLDIENGALSIPLLQVQEARPSAFRSAVGRTRTPKPFVLARLSVQNVQGNLEDPASLTGKGHLLFTNADRKEASVFDLPLEVIKRIGLDPGLLTPAAGEVFFVLQQGRCYLSSMHNTYSEGKRSQFYIEPERSPSYIGLDGTLHIDLKMKQNVLLKFTEPFTLSVRGTLDKPRYSLK
jgi:hypothetical protein